MADGRRTHDTVLADIKAHPERHHHSFEELQRCCFIEGGESGGALDLSLMEAHERYAPCGHNGGQACDTTSGPCSCGAWH